MKKRILSMILAVTMIAGLIPSAFAEESAIILPTERVGIDGLPQEGTYFTMGNGQAILDEHGRYALTIYRDGNVSGESTVDIKTIDVSAIYGKDYEIDDHNYETIVTEVSGTVMERFGDDEYLKQSSEDMETIKKNAEILDLARENGGMISLDEVEETGEGIEDITENEMSEDMGTGADNPLAAMKEAQTGEETRETYESVDTPILSELMGAGFDVANEMETSSTTTIVFGPNETEKQIVFKILDDDESEGQEMINFMLSNPSEDAAVTEPYTTTIVIEDDEPVVHPIINFDGAVYNAENNTVKITVKRTEPLYSYVTAVASTKDGTAKAGENYKGTKGTVEFLPYRDETSFEIPVVAGESETSFFVELSNLKGADEGEVMSLEVTIPKREEGAVLNDEDMAELLGNDTITVGDIKYKRVYEDNYRDKLYEDGNDIDVVGYYVKPSKFKDASFHGDSCKNRHHENKGDYYWLQWYSRWNRDLGGSFVYDYCDRTYFQSAWMDYKTTSQYDSSQCGFGGFEYGNWAVKAVRNKNSRAVRGHLKFLDANKKPASGTATIEMFAQRTNMYLVEPEAEIYGMVYFNKEYRISISDPDDMELKTASGKTRKAKPSFLDSDKKTVYTDGTITFSDYVANGEDKKWGELIGYDITCGDGGGVLQVRDGDYLSSDKMTLTFNQNLISQIDAKTKNVTETKKGYYTQLYIKPVYKRIPVIVDVLPAEKDALHETMGEFKSEFLKESSTDKLFLGDEISMDANVLVQGVSYNDYSFKAFENPGDTLPECSSDASNYIENKTVVLKYPKYEFKPLFSDLPNHIEIILDDEAAKYFELRNVISGNTTGVAGLKDKTLMKIDNGYTPKVGKAYNIELALKDGVELPDNLRPRITNVYNINEYVDGYSMYFIAKAAYKQNRFEVTMEEYTGDYKYWSVLGSAVYTSVGLLDNTAPLTNEPAKFNAVLAGSWLVDGVDKYGNDIKRIEHKATLTNEDGEFDIVGIKAVEGDKISVYVSNNNVDKVEYVTLKNTANRTEKKSFEELIDASTNDYGTLNEKCILQDMNPVDMPIITDYAPYIKNITLKYGQSLIPAGTTSIAIKENDTFFATARVEDNETNITAVQFVLYNRKGVAKGNLQTPYISTGKETPYIYECKEVDANGNYTVPIPVDDLEDGDMLYVRIIGDKDSSNNLYVTYPLLNIGIRFYTPMAAPERQEMSVDISDLGELPILGDLASSFDSGNLMWKTDYADPKNTGESAYTTTIGLSVAADFSKTPGKEMKLKNPKSISELREYRKGSSSEASKTNEEIVQEQMANFDPENVAASMTDSNMQTMYKDRINDNMSDAEKREVAKKLFEKEAYANNLNEMSKKWGITFGAKIMMQFDYAYDKTRGTHVFVGGEYLIAGSVSVKKTTYWIVMGFPVFLNFNGDVSIQVDGAWTGYNGDNAITATELKLNENLLNARFKNKDATPWVQVGLNIKLQAGVGYCGVLDAHCTLKLGLLTRFTFKKNQNDMGDKTSPGGFMVSFSGGIGVTLIFVKIEYTIGSIKQGWGVYNTNGPIIKGPQAGLDEADDEIDKNIKLKPLVLGDEQEVYNNAALMSVLRPVGEPENIIEDTLEVINPSAVQINNDGDIFMAYLSNNKSGDNANSVTLKYKIRNNETGWSEGIAVEPNGATDADPSVIFNPDAGEKGKVYVAWISSEEKLDNITDGSAKENLDTTKENLKKLSVYFKAYDVATNTWDKTIVVATDEFENTNVKLNLEDNNIAVYYFKRYVDNIESNDDILSLTKNYNTWAKKLYDTEKNEFVVLGKYVSGDKAGEEYTEKLISFPHDTVTDPLVTDLEVQNYTYKFENEDEVDYSLCTYTVDKDGDLQTISDRDVWLQIKNVTDDKTYYPIKIDGNKESVSNPRLTKTSDDILLTWLSNTSYFNYVSFKEILDSLRTEVSAEFDGSNDENYVPDYANSALSVFRGISSEDAMKPDWMKEAGKAAVATIGNEDGFTQHIADGEIIASTKDFGATSSSNTAIRKDADITDYKLIEGQDGNLYLFWTEPSDDANNFGKSLYASAFYTITDEWLEKYGTTNENGTYIDIKSGFSDGVKLTDTNLVIEEMTPVVFKDSSAIILANTYEQKLVEQESSSVNPIINGKHNLTEFYFKPFASIEVVDDTINISDEYPKPGQEVTFYWNIRNTGLLPTYGDSFKLEVLQDDKVIFSEESEYSGDSEAIYVGDTFKYETDTVWTVPDKLDLLKIRLTVNELNADNQVIENSYVVEKDIEHKASIEYTTVKIKPYSEVLDDIINGIFAIIAQQQYDNDDFEAEAELEKTISEMYPEYISILKSQDSLENALSDDDCFDYMVYLPIRNIGNKDADISAKIFFVDSELNKTDEVMGKTVENIVLKPITVDSDDVSYVIVPVQILPSQYNTIGYVKSVMDLYDGETRIAEGIPVIFNMTKNNDIQLMNDNSVNLSKGDTHQIDVKVYPFEEDKNVGYISYDVNVATVSNDGIITAVGAGKTTISAIDYDSSKIVEIAVNVEGEPEKPTPEPTDEPEKTPKPTRKPSSGGSGGGSSKGGGSGVVTGVIGGGAGIGVINNTVPTTNTPQTNASVFTDTKNHWAENAITKLAEKKIVNGMGDNTFAPNGNVTRAQFVQMLMNLGYVQNGTIEVPAFTDVNGWYNDAVKWAVSCGVAKGVSETEFAPDEIITREQMAVMINRFISIAGITTILGNSSVTDIDTASDWAKADIDALVKTGIVKGRDTGAFDPKANMTRAESAMVIYNIVEIADVVR